MEIEGYRFVGENDCVVLRIGRDFGGDCGCVGFLEVEREREREREIINCAGL